MTSTLVCWKCGAALAGLPQPLSRMAECPSCRTELHVCRMCREFDRHTQRQCREIRADEVVQKDRANFCDWFKARANAYDARAIAQAAAAKARWDALFGGDASAEPTATREKLDRLFDDDGKS